jgi:branched-chain amino acid transport system substrate-binding protein
MSKSKKVTRREFLRSAALTGAGLVAAACAPAATPPPQIVKETVVVAGTPQIVEKVITPTPLPAATATAVPVAPATIRVGTAIDITGPLTGFGIQCKWGYDHFMKVTNAAGGIMVKEYGKKIPLEMLYADHSADESKAVTAMEYLVQQKVHALSGTTAVMPLGQTVAEKAGIPMVMGNASLVDPFNQGFRYIFTISWMDDQWATWPYKLIDFFPDPKPTTIGFMEEQDLMGIDYSIYLQKEALNHPKIKLVIQKYQRFSSDFSTQIQAFKQQGADFLYLPMIGPDGMLFWKQMKQLNYVPKAALMFVAPADRASWLSMGKDANYVISTNGYHWDDGAKGAKELDKAWADEHNGDHCPELAGMCYAAMQVIANGIETAGTLNPVKLRDAIAATNMETVDGIVKFKPNGKSDTKEFAIQYQGGTEKIVWPADMATTKLVYPFPAWTDPNR